MNNKQLIIGILCAYLFIGCANNREQDKMLVDLSGQWNLKLDPNHEGIRKHWYNQEFTHSITLPGCLQEYGYGEKPGPETKWWTKLDLTQRHPSLAKYGKADDNFKLVQYLMPHHHYIGAAWYTREIEIPKSYKDKRVTLSLERCHWQSKVWVDGVELGSNESLATAHVYDLSQFSPGKHKIAIRVDNGPIYDIGKMPHSVSDQTQGTWNGIVGEIALKATAPVYIKSVKTYPDLKSKRVRVVVEVENGEGLTANYKLNANALGYNNGNQHDPEEFIQEGQLLNKKRQNIEFTYPMGAGTQLWDEFDPNLYTMDVTLESRFGNKKFSHTSTVSFGMREITTDGVHFYVNGIKTFMRGNVDCAVNPRTGYAPMSVERWKEIFQKHKDFGLNFVRFHSWCPPKNAFVAADEMGMYLAPEVHEWSYVTKPREHRYFKWESNEMLNYLGNHASFVMMGLGNESGIEARIAEDLIKQWKETDSRHLYTVKASVSRNAGKPDAMDFEVLGHVKDERFKGGRIRTRYQAFWPPLPENSNLCVMAPQTSLDWREGIHVYQQKNQSRPLMAHETAQFCAYPDVFNELKKYTGFLRPTYLEIAADQLEERGMTDQIPDFVKNSGKWQVLLTREETEAVLRTPNYAGFQWLALNDFTGQNTAPVGFTDAFFEDKSYVTGEEMRRFCAPTVLLARLPKRVYTSSQTLAAELEVSHFGKQQLHLNDLKVTVRDESGKKIRTQEYPEEYFGQGNVQKLGVFEFELSSLPAPAKYNLELSSASNHLANDWDFWVYPEAEVIKFPSTVKVTSQWNKATLDALQAGKTVVLLPKTGTLKGDLPGCFTTFYWTSFGEKGGQSSACGITLDNNHPLFKDFPTETHANWQWWELLSQCQPMILDQFEEQNPWPKAYRPLIQPIDSWKLNRKLGLVVEAKIGAGKLLICSIDLEGNLKNRPVARQFRKSLIDYVQSTDFDPQTEIKASAVSALFDQSKPEIKLNLQGLPTEG